MLNYPMPSLLWEEYLSYPVNDRFGCVTCFGQWDVAEMKLAEIGNVPVGLDVVFCPENNMLR